MTAVRLTSRRIVDRMPTPREPVAERTIASALSARSTVLLQPADSAHQAACRMDEAGCGCALVMSRGRIVGIVTAGDIMRKIVAKQENPTQATVESIMTHKPLCGDPEMSVIHALYTMKELGLKYFPVIDSRHEPLGVFSLDDAFPSELVRAGVLASAKDMLTKDAD